MMKIKIIEDSVTPKVEQSIGVVRDKKTLLKNLMEFLEEVYEIIEEDIPKQTGYLRASGREQKNWIVTDAGTSMGITMRFSGEDNPPENRRAYGWTKPPIYPNNPYALHQYVDKGNPWFHENWAEIEENFEFFAEQEFERMLTGWF